MLNSRLNQNILLNKLQNKQAFMLYGSIFLCLTAIWLWLYIPYSIQIFNLSIFLGTLFGVAILSAIPFFYSSFKRRQNRQLLQQINAHPEMEFSAQLLLKEPKQLNNLEKLQVDKIQNRLKFIYKDIKLPHFLWKALFIFVVNLFLVVWAVQFQTGKHVVLSKPTIIEIDHLYQASKSQTPLPIAQLKNYFVKINPPEYTRLKASTQKKMSLSAPEGSTIKWRLQFDGIPTTTPFVEIAGKTIPFISNDLISYTAQHTLQQKTLYSLPLDTAVKASIFNTLHELHSIADKKPTVRIVNLKNYQQIRHSEVQVQLIQYILQDDYGISSAALQIMKSSGDGESVRFEEKIYTLPTVAKDWKQSISINLLDLKPQPGDEFFIRIEAADNHPTKKQGVFSDTYIIAVEDTTRKQADFTMALGMDSAPEFFRSQRQIIIDTEALIEAQKQLTEISFREQSNNLGIEQKLLRLRYGKFLGEEFEGEIGVRTSSQPKSKALQSRVVDKNNTEDIDQHRTQKENILDDDAHSGHDHNGHNHNGHNHDEHDHHQHVVEPLAAEKHLTQKEKMHQHGEHCAHDDNHEPVHDIEDEQAEGAAHQVTEHNHSHDHGNHHHHDHGGASKNPEVTKNWLAPFQHFHDNAESNTFFESEVKAKLKAALAQMWDAELQLRLGQPNLSLPYQHMALKLIKEVQQANRIYVERIGLDIPAIDEDKKRLSGPLSEIINPKQSYTILPDPMLQNVHLALQKIEALKMQAQFTEGTNQTLSEIKALLNTLQPKNEHLYVLCMHTLHQIPNNKAKLQALQFILNNFLKDYEPISGKAGRKNSRLEALYWQHVN